MRRLHQGAEALAEGGFTYQAPSLGIKQDTAGGFVTSPAVSFA